MQKHFGDELPERYTCLACGVCIATSEALSETRGDVLVFSRLYCEKFEMFSQAQKSTLCPYCEYGLGTRGDSSCYLRADRLLRRTASLEVLVMSLKQQEITDLVPVLQQAFPKSNVQTHVLLKSELRGFQLSRISPDFVVVAHRNEGRVLLTDRNGFYHDVLGSAWQQTLGNVMVVVTKADPKVASDLFDAQLLRSLSTQGDQPTIGAISSMGRVLTWDTNPSATQMRQLQELATKAFFREPPASIQGLPLQWTGKPQKQQVSTWCNLL